MAGTNEKYLKAVLYADNFIEQPGNLLRTNCYTVQDYQYHCYRKRDEYGNPYGPILSKQLDFSVIVSNVKGTKVFYERLGDRETRYFSFIFNANFNEMGRLEDYEDGMMAKGYVIDVVEETDEGEASQLLIHVKMLLSDLSFLGIDSVNRLSITND